MHLKTYWLFLQNLGNFLSRSNYVFSLRVVRNKCKAVICAIEKQSCDGTFSKFQGLSLFNLLGLGRKLKAKWVIEEWLGAGLRREVRINQRMLITKEKFYQHHHYHYDTCTGLLIDCQHPPPLPWSSMHSFELTSKITWTLQQYKQNFHYDCMG